ncbi:hypothetical protein BCR37DRAFT_404122 [Protomyces lactucae-debilis]|uniref:Gfo/Idh/MocA-like oxidoreductase N-terminal domain-containing protein n=1 Tax=Protomyces lactucae-debilis TaxID=2754530 RepID=A0A1Y2FW90_PROLT|nr:uncharacterized protein BCR37DRAFT_404122 [Protomyces lactucae-debilis]ORY87807.1 hypothetical protein BCR37DRAFT_404122 [Protomyces lactucae-debilis]
MSLTEITSFSLRTSVAFNPMLVLEILRQFCAARCKRSGTIWKAYQEKEDYKVFYTVGGWADAAAHASDQVNQEDEKLMSMLDACFERPETKLYILRSDRITAIKGSILQLETAVVLDHASVNAVLEHYYASTTTLAESHWSASGLSTDCKGLVFVRDLADKAADLLSLEHGAYQALRSAIEVHTSDWQSNSDSLLELLDLFICIVTKAEMSPLRVAILGAGIFVKEEHLPSVLASPNFELKALYSRSASSLKDLIQGNEAASRVDLYFSKDDENLYPDRKTATLEALLNRQDIDAVIIALPILVQPDIIKQCLTAGKHVIAEKPVAKDIATARNLIAFATRQKPMLAIAENYRMESHTIKAKELVASGVLGKIHYVNYRMLGNVQKGSKYFETAWRKEPQYQGGFVLDGGVHWVAAIRDVLGCDMLRVGAIVTLNREHLLPCDQVLANIVMQDGTPVNFFVSFASEWSNMDEAFIVSGDKGYLSIKPGQVTLVVNGETTVFDTSKSPVDWPVSSQQGVYSELEAFAAAVKQNMPDERLSPENAFKDLAAIETILESGKKDGQPLDIPTL